MTELEDVIHIPSESAPTLSMLDSGLKRFMSLCASYHGEAGTAIPPMYFTNVNEYTEQYLQSPFQLEHACELILDSELFAFHSERMCEILVDEAQSVSNPFRFPPSQMISLSLWFCTDNRPPSPTHLIQHPPTPRPSYSKISSIA